MRKSEKTRIILIIMTVICIVFLAGNVALMLAGFRVNSQIDKVSESEKSLQTELEATKEERKADKVQIEKDKAQIEETQAEEEAQVEEEPQAEEVQTEEEPQMQELQESSAVMDGENEGN